MHGVQVQTNKTEKAKIEKRSKNESVRTSSCQMKCDPGSTKTLEAAVQREQARLN